MKDAVSEVDLGAILDAGESPFPVVEARVRALAAGEQVVFLAPFEPVPLYEHIRAWGAHLEVARADSVFRITVRKEEEAEPNIIPLFMDLRHLPPPEPMTRTIETYGGLRKGEILIVHVPHRPVHLLDHLERRGITWDEQEQTDGSFHIYLEKGASA